MVISERKYNDLKRFSDPDLLLKEEEMFDIYTKLSEKAKISDDKWYTEQKCDCFFDLLAIREWMRLKGVEVPDRQLLDLE